jgi:hypothetical protein
MALAMFSTKRNNDVKRREGRKGGKLVVPITETA